MRILFVTPYVPSPIRVRPYQWVRTLARLGQRVHLIALRPPEDTWLDDIPVRECCESVSVFPLSRLRTLYNAAAAVPRDLPLQAAYSLHPAAERFIASRATRDCDVVHVEHLRGALLARRVRGVPRVLDAVDSITALFSQAKHQAPSWRHRLMARLDLDRTRRFEAAVSARFDRMLVTSRQDAHALQDLGGTLAADQVVTVPNGVDLDYFRPGDQPPEPATVLFSGKMSYHANEAAALRLVQQVMPRVWAQRPDARVVIAGKDPSPAVRALARDPRVTVTGLVSDLRPLFWSATVVAAPLVYATGIQNKVLEAMACGVPVVASPQACGGISVVGGRDLLIGQNDDEIAEHALTLIRDDGTRRHMGMNGRRYVVAHHDWYDMGRRLIAVYEEARAARRRCA